MRELTKQEKKIIDHIDRLEEVSISELLNAEFSAYKFAIGGSTLLIYPNGMALNRLEGLDKKIVVYCIDCVRVLELLEINGLLTRLQYHPEFEKKRFTETDTFCNAAKEDRRKGILPHKFPYRGVAERVAILNKWTYLKSDSLKDFIRNGYALPGEARERINLHLAVLALFLTVLFSFADLGLSLIESDVDLTIKLALLAIGFASGFVIYKGYIKK
ncbi:hypothetical protein [Pontibacter mangrovi]|uniref:Uncharacterized protein n=1 Tax=Pontibacter mangrovi TaxID=2589816 RepID=A0A501WEI7_9BACT|nr:hypothetical protein [Pontibacter mangrovi]TPE43976.1 hypothetical protein FJM65_11160 [Pontibacter mangrovi]